MKNRQKALILAVAAGLILTMMIGGIVARESVQVCKVYSRTAGYTEDFVAIQSNDWSWSIDHHALPYQVVGMSVYDVTANLWLLNNNFINYDCGGNLDITYNHTMRVSTQQGEYSFPGWATCSVQSVLWNPDAPIHE